MALHANAALSVKKRLLVCQRVVEQNWTLAKAAAAAEVSVRTARKWVRRYRAEGEPGLVDRPSTRCGSQREPVSSACRRSPPCGGCG
jgi:transposase